MKVVRHHHVSMESRTSPATLAFNRRYQRIPRFFPGKGMHKIKHGGGDKNTLPTPAPIHPMPLPNHFKIMYLCITKQEPRCLRMKPKTKSSP